MDVDVATVTLGVGDMYMCVVLPWQYSTPAWLAGCVAATPLLSFHVYSPSIMFRLLFPRFSVSFCSMHPFDFTERQHLFIFDEFYLIIDSYL